MNLFETRPTVSPAEHIQQIKQWGYELLDLSPDVSIPISQLRCHEPRGIV